VPAELTVGDPGCTSSAYGENPHQRGALYAVPGPPGGMAHARRLQGAPLSFTNWLDVDSARALVAEFDEPGGLRDQDTQPVRLCLRQQRGACIPPGLRNAIRDPRYGGIAGLTARSTPRDGDGAHRTSSKRWSVPRSTTMRWRTSPPKRASGLVVDRPSGAEPLDAAASTVGCSFRPATG